MLLAILVAVLLGASSPAAGAVTQDAELALLLRSMAAMKLVLVAVVFAGAWWRLGHPVVPAFALAYAGGVATMTLAGVLLMQLTHLAQSAAVFHGAAFAVLMLALQDRELAGSVLPGLLARRRARAAQDVRGGLRLDTAHRSRRREGAGG